jgi:hypothetical protein
MKGLKTFQRERFQSIGKIAAGVISVFFLAFPYNEGKEIHTFSNKGGDL